jgi:cytochrome c oxidase accessory protein FixG
VVCPYGRLQSVLLDKKSIVVAYDFVRGEPRGKIEKNKVEATPKGDCIDCKLCVHVCPTGIDIRNGTQMECINCTACIDACDEVMVKIGKPKKLIRYDSLQGITDKIPLKFNTRLVAYTVVLLLLSSLLTYFLVSREPVELTVLRTPGMLYQQPDSVTISNLYNAEIVNKTADNLNLEVKVKDNLGTIKLVTQNATIAVPKQEVAKTSFFILIPKKSLTSYNTKLYVQVYANGKLMTESKTSFASP